MITLVREAKVATRDVMKELEVVLLSTVSLVTYALVVVELPMIRSEIEAKVATRDEMKELEEVESLAISLSVNVVEDVLFVVTRLVLVALIAVRLVVEAVVRYAFVAVIPVAEAVERVVCPDTVRRVAVVVAKVEVPVTVRVPPMDSLPVIVEVPVVAVFVVR
jgi:hypothetical protein